MDRAQVVLLGLPIFLLFTDIVNLFTPPPPKPVHRPPARVHYQPKSQAVIQEPPEFPTEKRSGNGGIGYGSIVNINFCVSCSYRGTAITMKNMLESSFPGVEVILANYPPPLPKRLLSKVVPVVQFGIIATIMAGEQIFPRLGMAPPPWYYSLRANRFGSIASTWLFGNFIQSFLQSSGAFEVYCDGEMVFSKLKEQRFPGEIELRDLIGRKLSESRIIDNSGGVWS
ncbi:selT-like protein [Momordica charantia]|uniref:SelT-like protein n=1 Tax=Momordica charantia TaxID=3673 RepID=A0A6J1CXI9_MOMCH|nr:selT-like protein [Momordica charantia]